MNSFFQQRQKRRAAPAASATKGAVGRGLIVEFELDILEGRRLVRRLPRARNLILDKGLDLVSAVPWAQLCHYGVLGTDSTADILASKGFGVGGIVIGALGLITVNVPFFDGAHVGKTLVFDSLGDYGRASFTVASVTSSTIAHVAAGNGHFPAFDYSTAPTTLYIVEPGRVALEAAVKSAATANSGNDTILSALGNGSSITWIHNIVFDDEIAPAHYDEAGWTPPNDITFNGISGLPTYGAAAPLTQQLFGRAVLPDGGIDIDTGQHAVLRVYLTLSFAPLTTPEILAPFWPWIQRTISGVNVFRLLANGTYVAGEVATPIVPADGILLWGEPGTWQPTDILNFPYVSLDKCPCIACKKTPHILVPPVGVFLAVHELAEFNTPSPAGPTQYPEGPWYLVGSYQRIICDTVLPYPAGEDPDEFQICLLDRDVVTPAATSRNVFAAWKAQPDPPLTLPGHFWGYEFDPVWDRAMPTLAP